MTGPVKYIFITVVAVYVWGCTSIVHASTLSMSVAQQTVSEGDTFVTDWYLDTEGESVNVVDATLFYSPETLSVESVFTGSSVISLWIEKPQIQEPGSVHFVGGIPAGVVGKKIPIMKLVFRAKATGNASIALDQHATVVLSNGVATKEVIQMQPILFSVFPKSVSIVRSSTHPKQEKWSHKTDARIHISDSSPVVYSLSTNSEVIPSGTPAIVKQDIEYTDLKDGVYYFKVAIPVEDSFQELQTYRLMIDTTPAIIADAHVDTTSELFNGHDSLHVYAIDKTSGVSSIEARVGWFGLYHHVNGPFELHKPFFGNRITIRVFDYAGNKTISTVYYRGYLANWVSYCVTLGIVLWIVYSIVRNRSRIYFFLKRFF